MRLHPPTPTRATHWAPHLHRRPPPQPPARHPPRSTAATPPRPQPTTPRLSSPGSPLRAADAGHLPMRCRHVADDPERPSFPPPQAPPLWTHRTQALTPAAATFSPCHRDLLPPASATFFPLPRTALRMRGSAPTSHAHGSPPTTSAPHSAGTNFLSPLTQSFFCRPDPSAFSAHASPARASFSTYSE
ncbi:hypothetical protein VPH35_013399 [Triticum aestivum]